MPNQAVDTRSRLGASRRCDPVMPVTPLRIVTPAERHGNHFVGSPSKPHHMLRDGNALRPTASGAINPLRGEEEAWMKR